jgi:hypothetical protein
LDRLRALGEQHQHLERMLNHLLEELGVVRQEVQRLRTLTLSNAAAPEATEAPRRECAGNGREGRATVTDKRLVLPWTSNPLARTSAAKPAIR